MTEIRIIDRSKIAETFSSEETGIYNIQQPKEETLAKGQISKKGLGALVLAGVLFSAGGGAFFAYVSEEKPLAQPVAPKVVPENPLPSIPKDEVAGVTTTDAADVPLVVDYKLSNLRPGVAGKDCKPHGSYYIEPSVVPITINKKSYKLEMPKTEVSLYSCGTNVKAFVDNVELVDTTLLGVDGREVPVKTYKKNVLINTDTVDFSAKITSKEVPKIIPLSAAQRMQDKSYNGKNICDSYPKLEGCNGEYTISKKQSASIIATAQLFAVQSIGRLCSDNEYNAFKNENAKLFDTDAKNQYFDANLVSETYANSALRPITAVPNYIKGLEKVLIKNGAIQDGKTLTALFGTGLSVVAKCDMESK